VVLLAGEEKGQKKVLNNASLQDLFEKIKSNLSTINTPVFPLGFG